MCHFGATLYMRVCDVSDGSKVVNSSEVASATGDNEVEPGDTSLPGVPLGETSSSGVPPGVTSSSTCPSCQSTFATLSSLVAHVTTSHSRGTVRRRLGTANSLRPFRCYRCWKTFSVEAKLRLHVLSHSESLKNFTCEVSSRLLFQELRPK